MCAPVVPGGIAPNNDIPPDTGSHFGFLNASCLWLINIPVAPKYTYIWESIVDEINTMVDHE